MRLLALYSTVIVYFVLTTTLAAEDPAKAVSFTKATYSITGLHCPPCSQTVASSLQRTSGVKSATVDWQSKTAKLTFDEGVISAQKVSQAIAGTPHMMGGGMQYGGWLALSVPSLADEEKGQVVQQSLSQIQGVAKVVTYPRQQTASVQFSGRGSVTSQQLIEALADNGIKASTY